MTDEQSVGWYNWVSPHEERTLIKFEEGLADEIRTQICLPMIFRGEIESQTIITKTQDGFEVENYFLMPYFGDQIPVEIPS